MVTFFDPQTPNAFHEERVPAVSSKRRVHVVMPMFLEWDIQQAHTGVVVRCPILPFLLKRIALTMA